MVTSGTFKVGDDQIKKKHTLEDYEELVPQSTGSVRGSQENEVEDLVSTKTASFLQSLSKSHEVVGIIL